MTRPFSTAVADGIAELVLDNPPVNAFDTRAQFAMAAEIEALGRRAGVRVIVIRAEGRGFCAGIDVKEVAADPAKILDANRGNYDAFAAIHLNPRPVIAAVHGYVLGGGIGIAGSADVVVAADDAYFAVPEVDRGGMGMGAHLQRMFPVQKVRHMYFTGLAVDAAEAHRLGAVERVVPRDRLREEALDIARTTIAAKSPVMIEIAKRSLTGVEDGSLEDKYRWEQGFTFEAYLTGDSKRPAPPSWKSATPASATPEAIPPRPASAGGRRGRPGQGAGDGAGHDGSFAPRLPSRPPSDRPAEEARTGADDYCRAARGASHDRRLLPGDLAASEQPTQWYNIVATCPRPRRRLCTPAPWNRSGPTTWPPCSRWPS